MDCSFLRSHERFRRRQSALLGESLQSPFVPSLRLYAIESIKSSVAQLNAFQPQSLAGYPSILRPLAEAQLAGRLHIKPLAVFSAEEVMPMEIRALIEKAWSIQPFDVYGTTETGGIDSECTSHCGMHLFEDLVILENVDDQNRPVPPGAFGTKILLTVLFSRTLPLIRYEITDCVRLSLPKNHDACSCGMNFQILSGIEGRASDILLVADELGGTVAIHPNLFHNRLESLPAKVWQVIQEAPEKLRILVSGLRSDFDLDTVGRELTKDIASAGGRVSDFTECVEAIPVGPNGKAACIKVSPFPG